MGDKEETGMVKGNLGIHILLHWVYPQMFMNNPLDNVQGEKRFSAMGHTGLKLQKCISP